jgi:PAS domain S-box-containing protein
MEGIAKDVTEAAAAAAEISKLKDDLEHRVSLRTEQLQRSNEQLRVSEARYRNVVDTQSDFIVRWSPDGTRTFVNDAYCAFQSKSPCELLGRKFLPLVHPDDRQAFNEALASISPAHPVRAFEGRVLRRDESYSWMQWNTRGFFDDQGKVAEYQSVGRDVSQLRAAADLLRQKEVHLAHLSRLATMGEMVAGIAHEINQPLHAAKTFAEAARRNLQSGGADRIDTAINCMTEISDAVTRTVQIIRRLREFTKAQPFELESLSINHVVNEALQLAAYEIRRVGATLRLDLAKSLPAISGDRIQLEQLLVNLLLNACEAMEPMPAGQRILKIQSRLDGEDIRLAIIDAGVGVADPSRLFEPFFTTKSGGMGMGMVLCKSIAEAHGIDLGFENNQEGPGATFILTIPAAGARSS